MNAEAARILKLLGTLTPDQSRRRLGIEMARLNWAVVDAALEAVDQDLPAAAKLARVSVVELRAPLIRETLKITEANAFAPVRMDFRFIEWCAIYVALNRLAPPPNPSVAELAFAGGIRQVKKQIRDALDRAIAVLGAS